jgi:hypothetical protein
MAWANRIQKAKSFREAMRQNGRSPKSLHLVLKVSGRRKSVVVTPSTQDYQEAIVLLRRKMARAEQRCSLEHSNRISLDQLFNLLVESYQSKRRHTAEDMLPIVKTQIVAKEGDQPNWRLSGDWNDT